MQAWLVWARTTCIACIYCQTFYFIFFLLFIVTCIHFLYFSLYYAYLQLPFGSHSPDEPVTIRSTSRADAPFVLWLHGMSDRESYAHPLGYHIESPEVYNAYKCCLGLLIPISSQICVSGSSSDRNSCFNRWLWLYLFQTRCKFRSFKLACFGIGSSKFDLVSMSAIPAISPHGWLIKYLYLLYYAHHRTSCFVLLVL